VQSSDVIVLVVGVGTVLAQIYGARVVKGVVASRSKD
jgi:hypothetical protein